MLIFLTGFMGSGKSESGLLLASACGYSFVDTDRLIEQQWGIGIDDFFKHHGEAAFRRAEREVLLRVLSLKNTVVACGGGLPCFNDHMALINTSGLSVYLKLTPHRLAARLEKMTDERPLLKNISPDMLTEHIQKMLTEREQYYMMAKIIIEAENDDAYTEKLISEVKKFID